MLFAWAHPAIMVASILNARWLCQSETLVPVPTEHVPKALEFLASIGYPVDEHDLGVTPEHRKYFEASVTTACAAE